MPLSVRIALLLASAALGAAPARADTLKVVTTTTDLRSLTEFVGGDKVEAAALGSGREDPHFIDAKPSCMLLASSADLWIRIGMELEIGYERLILEGSRNARIQIGAPGHLDVSAGVLRLEVPTGTVDRSMGDIHPLGNPHCWLDPLNARIIARTIASRLAQLRPGDAAYFTQRLAAFELKLDAAMFGPRLMDAAAKVAGGADQAGAKLWALLLKGELDAFADRSGGATDGWWGRMRPLRGATIVTYHRSWGYFANRFGLTVAAELEPKPGIEPTPGHLAEVMQIVEQQHVKFLMMEPFYSRKAPDWLADKTRIKVVQVANSVDGDPQATDYIRLIDLIVERCVAAGS